MVGLEKKIDEMIRTFEEMNATFETWVKLWKVHKKQFEKIPDFEKRIKFLEVLVTDDISQIVIMKKGKPDAAE